MPCAQQDGSNRARHGFSQRRSSDWIVRFSLSFLDVDLMITSSNVSTIVYGKPGVVPFGKLHKVLQHQARFGPSHAPFAGPFRGYVAAPRGY